MPCLQVPTTLATLMPKPRHQEEGQVACGGGGEEELAGACSVGGKEEQLRPPLTDLVGGGEPIGGPGYEGIIEKLLCK